MARKQLTEEQILQLFRRELRLTKPHELNITGNADDAAVMPLLPSLFQTLAPGARKPSAQLSDGIVLTQDGLIEGVHFRLDYFTPAQVVAKCMAVNLSDLAAMGAHPLGALVYVGLPRKYAHEEFVLSLSEGLRSSMRKYGYTIFGGDVTAARDLTISAAMVGRVQCARTLRRSGAKPGDTVFLSGRIGLASLGLRILERQRARKPVSLVNAYPAAIARATAPEPRVKLGIELAERGLATSCIDLSDSLSKSLLLIAKESRVGLELEVKPRLLHPEVLRHFGKLEGIELMRAVLAAEEDFELLFTARAKTAKELGLSSRNALPIGRVLKPKEGIYAVIDGNRIDIPLLGYEHFAG